MFPVDIFRSTRW